PQAAVALVFYHSGSMAAALSTFLPVGAALADALATDTGVEVALWRYGSSVERVARSEDLRQGRTMGGTATNRAATAAASWVRSRETQLRFLVIFTDGKPDYQEQTAAEVVDDTAAPRR